MKSQKKLIINADDYGLSREVNAAIEELIRAGVLASVSVLVNGNVCEPAIEFLRSNSQVSVGIHLNLVEGKPSLSSPQLKPLLTPDGTFAGRSRVFKNWARSPVKISRAVEIEWQAQIESLLKTGLRIAHADSHQHLHAFPFAFRIALKLCREFNIPCLRIPREVNRNSQRRAGALGLRASLIAARLFTPQFTIKTNDHFLGFKRAGDYGITELLTDLDSLAEGITELALHPSTQNFVPYPSLRGDDERRALLDPRFPERIKKNGIELINWNDI